jgi:hypothetical protein
LLLDRSISSLKPRFTISSGSTVNDYGFGHNGQLEVPLTFAGFAQNALAPELQFKFPLMCEL